MVMGSCVYDVAHQGMLQAMKQAGRNVEMPNFTQALYEARELAMERMQKEAEELRAQGIVGVQLQEKSHGWGSHIIEFFAVGTAVIPFEGGHAIPPPSPVLSLNDRNPCGARAGAGAISKKLAPALASPGHAVLR
jgi:uncharacterized protein YbjQ (UPF0145 family)